MNRWYVFHHLLQRLRWRLSFSTLTYLRIGLWSATSTWFVWVDKVNTVVCHDCFIWSNLWRTDLRPAENPAKKWLSINPSWLVSLLQQRYGWIFLNTNSKVQLTDFKHVSSFVEMYMISLSTISWPYLLINPRELKDGGNQSHQNTDMSVRVYATDTT